MTELTCLFLGVMPCEEFKLMLHFQVFVFKVRRGKISSTVLEIKTL